MSSTYRKFQLVLRILISAVAFGLFVAGIYNLAHYYGDRSAEKTAVTAQVITRPHDKDDVILRYTFDGKIFENEPVDKFLHDYGKVGDELTVYVENHSPNRVFLKRPPVGEAYFAFILFGWGLVLALIVYAERRILQILEKPENDKN